MIAHTEIRPKCYTWSEKDFEEGGLQRKDEEYPFDIVLSALSREALAYLQNKSTKVVSIVTDGDGACGVHAVFGTPSVRGTLFKDSSRELAVSLLGPNSEALQQARVDERYVAAISESFWNEFVKPVLDSKPDSDTVEGLLFWKTLQKQKPVLAEQCQQAHIQYGIVTQDHVQARQDLLKASQIFSQLIWSCLLCDLWLLGEDICREVLTPLIFLMLITLPISEKSILCSMTG